MGVLTQQFLLKMRFENVAYVKNTKGGIQKLSENNYNIILLDWFLGDKEATIFLEHLKQQDVMDTTALILVTSHKDACIKDEDWGIKDHLIKPFDFKMLENCINRALKEQKKL